MKRANPSSHPRPIRMLAMSVVGLVTAAALGSGVAPAAAAAPAVEPGEAPAEVVLPSEPSEDPFVRQLQIEQERAQLREGLAQLEATNADLQAILAELQARIDAQTAALSQAERDRAAATEAARLAADAERAKAREVRELEALMRRIAVDAYVNPPADDKLSAVLQGGDLNDLSTAMTYFDAKFGHDVDVVEQLKRARAELAERRREASEARAAAAAHSDQVALTLTELQANQVGHQEMAALLQQRMGEVGQREAALQAEVGGLDGAMAERRQALRSLASGTSGGDVPLATVQGIQVHVSLAAPLEALLAAARADGIILGGGGHRSFEAQIATRRANCGGDEHAIWHMPASQCSPPTARPGSSMHERGLAVDFTVGGSVISSQDSPAFRWLAEHAARYGFHNLPSEPWHWSTTGG